MIKKFVVSLILSLICIPASSKADTPITGESIGDMRSFDQAILRIMSENAIPGGSLAVAYNGKLVALKSYGYARKKIFADPIPAHPNHRWRVASVSKPITSIMILKLFEQGKLSLDDRLLDHLGDEQSPRLLADKRFQQVTIRQLLQHRSGLLSQSDDPMTGNSPPCPVKTRRWIESHRLADDPGSKFSYSNTGYCLLGHVIEKASGESYEKYVIKVLAEIGIKSIRMAKSAESDENEVEYFNSPDESRTPYSSFSLEDLSAAGGLLATPKDLVRFADHLFGKEPSLLKSREAVLELTTPPPDSDGKSFYGLGFFVALAEDGQMTMFHPGSLIGTSAFVARFADGWTVAATFNRRKKDRHSLTRQIGNELSSARKAAKPPEAPEELSAKITLTW